MLELKGDWLTGIHLTLNIKGMTRKEQEKYADYWDCVVYRGLRHRAFQVLSNGIDSHASDY